MLTPSFDAVQFASWMSYSEGAFTLTLNWQKPGLKNVSGCVLCRNCAICNWMSHSCLHVMSFSFSCNVQSRLWCQDEFLHYLLLSLLCKLHADVIVMGSIHIDYVFIRAKTQDKFKRWQICLWCSCCRPAWTETPWTHFFAARRALWNTVLLSCLAQFWLWDVKSSFDAVQFQSWMSHSWGAFTLTMFQQS